MSRKFISREATSERINLKNAQDYMVQSWELLIESRTSYKASEINKIKNKMKFKYKDLFEDFHRIQQIYLNLK